MNCASTATRQPECDLIWSVLELLLWWLQTQQGLDMLCLCVQEHGALPWLKLDTSRLWNRMMCFWFLSTEDSTHARPGQQPFVLCICTCSGCKGLRTGNPQSHRQEMLRSHRNKQLLQVLLAALLLQGFFLQRVDLMHMHKRRTPIKHTTSFIPEQ